MNLKNLTINLTMTGILVSAPLYPKNIIKCPRTLSAWLRQNTKKQAECEKCDHWKTPKEMMKDKAGDCEDFAFLNQAILKDLGYETKVIWIYGNIKSKNIKNHFSHAICIFRNNNKWQIMDNQDYIYWESFDTVAEIAKWECDTWVWWREIKLPKKYDKKHWRYYVEDRSNN